MKNEAKRIILRIVLDIIYRQLRPLYDEGTVSMEKIDGIVRLLDGLNETPEMAMKRIKYEYRNAV